ncbi:MAG: ABC-2 family transporter protein [Clostridiales bacterium]|jgi:ABC-2 type transport system permease protein|nr:ABC-2 family transporter protein [Clostridiales bacterium]
MNYLKHKFGVLKAVAFVTYKEWSVYRTHSMVSIFVGPVYFIVQYFIWTSVYGANSEINSLTLADMVRYFGASALIGYLTMDFADWNLSMLIRTGKFLTFTLRPINHRFFAFSQKAGHRVLGFFVEFIPCLIIFTLLFGVDLTPANIPYAVISVILAFLMNFYVNYCLGMLSFWFVQSGGVRTVFQLVSGIFSGSLVPLVFFPDWLQRLQFFLPFQYITYLPVMVFLGEYSLGGVNLPLSSAILLQAAAVAVVFAVSEILYRVSIKHFTGVGA